MNKKIILVIIINLIFQLRVIADSINSKESDDNCQEKVDSIFSALGIQKVNGDYSIKELSKTYSEPFYNLSIVSNKLSHQITSLGFSLKNDCEINKVIFNNHNVNNNYYEIDKGICNTLTKFKNVNFMPTSVYLCELFFKIQD